MSHLNLHLYKYSIQFNCIVVTTAIKIWAQQHFLNKSRYRFLQPKRSHDKCFYLHGKLKIVHNCMNVETIYERVEYLINTLVHCVTSNHQQTHQQQWLVDTDSVCYARLRTWFHQHINFRTCNIMSTILFIKLAPQKLLTCHKSPTSNISTSK